MSIESAKAKGGVSKGSQSLFQAQPGPQSDFL